MVYLPYAVKIDQDVFGIDEYSIGECSTVLSAYTVYRHLE